MPTVAELERLDALVARLRAIGATAPGELIRADDWNLLVGALVEVARAVLAEGSAEGAPAHEHPEQVTLGWLAPSLRALIQRGPVSDPAAEGRLDEVDRRLGRISSGAETLRAEVEGVRTLAARVEAAALRRESDLSRVERNLDGRVDAREEVAALRATLATIEDRVGIAVELAARLQDDGEPVDLVGLVGRVTAVEAVHERLRDAQGELLDAAALDRKLAALEASLVTEEELDEALRARGGGLGEEERERLREELRAAVAPDVQAATSAVEERLRAEVAERLGAVDAQVARAVADATPGITDRVTATVREELSAVEVELRGEVDATRTGLDERLGGLRGDLERTAGELAARTDEGLARVQEESGARLDEGLGRVQQELGARLDEGLGRAQEEFGARLDEALGRMQEEVGARLDKGFAEAQEQLAARVEEASARTREELFAALDERLAPVQGRIDELARMDRRLGALLEKLQGRVDELDERMRRLEG